MSAAKDIKIQVALDQALKLHQNGDISGARRAYEKVLRKHPKHPVALHLLGMVYKANEDFKKAEQLIRRALVLEPNYSEAQFNLANMLKDLKRYEEAEQAYRAAIKIRPDYVGAYNNLAHMLYMLDRNQESIECAHQAIAIDPNHVGVWSNLGCTLRAVGRIDEARQAFQTALDIDPYFIEAHWQISEMKKYQPGDPDIDRLRQLAQDSSVTQPNRENLLYALGKVYDDLQDYDQAFEFYKQANTLKRSNFPEYRISEVAKFFSNNRKYFPQFGWEKQTDIGCMSEQPIFIIGMPRSGTTLVEQILASHPDVYGAGETLHMSKTMERIGKPDHRDFLTTLQQTTEEERREMGEHYLSRLSEPAPEGILRITDKMPDNHKNVGFIYGILPKARIIHCKREPIDSCVSMFRCNFAYSIPYTCDLTELGQYYALYHESIQFWESLFPGRMYHLQYETLVSDFENQVRQLLEYCGLEWDERCLEFYKAERSVLTASDVQVRSPLYQSSVGKWAKRYGEHLDPLREQLDGLMRNHESHAA